MEAHVYQQNEDLGSEVFRRQSISGGSSPPIQGTRSPFDLRATSSQGDRLQRGGATETNLKLAKHTRPQKYC
ncbi:hypothetical protein V3C99_001621 [Haemonchus contortus]